MANIPARNLNLDSDKENNLCSCRRCYTRLLSCWAIISHVILTLVLKNINLCTLLRMYLASWAIVPHVFCKKSFIRLTFTHIVTNICHVVPNLSNNRACCAVSELKSTMFFLFEKQIGLYTGCFRQPGH